MFNRCPRPNPMDSMQGQMNTGFIDIDNNSGNIDIDFAQAANSKAWTWAFNNLLMGPSQAPIVEPMQERVVNRTDWIHNVPHVW